MPGVSKMKQYHLINILQLVFTTLFIISAVFYLTLKSDAENQKYVEFLRDSFPEYKESISRPELTSPPSTSDWDIASISLVVTAIGTFFAIFFRWRADIRNTQRAKEQAQKNELRFKKLEDEIRMIKAKLE